MPKKIPPCPAESPRDTRRIEERSYRIELLTPLFGGGVEAGENDPSMPIRATSIRGQLQFWWRATIGAACSNLEELRAKHQVVWGATEHASPVVVHLSDIQTSEPEPCGKFRWDPQASRGRGGWRLDWQNPFGGRDSHLPYALFPFQGTMPQGGDRGVSDEPPARCTHHAAFTLHLRYPDELRSDVETAVWAWVNFGGLGARTRRGCGALRCDELAPSSIDQVPEWFRQRCEGLSRGREGDSVWPTLPNRLLVGTTTGPPIPVWDWLVGLLKYFRQGSGFARNQGQQSNRPGRSRYPEPETIREVLRANRGMSGHQRLPQIPADAYPRAEFGLPIVFHFQGRGEPPDTTLQPRVGGQPAERMASPLVLKPLALAGGQTIPVLLALRTPGVSEVELYQGSQLRGSGTEQSIRRPQLSTYANSPLAGLSSDGSALEAVLNFARNESDPGFVEITR